MIRADLVRNFHQCQGSQKTNWTKVIFLPLAKKRQHSSVITIINVFQTLLKNKVFVHMIKDHMKLKGGFREKKGTYDLMTTICNITDKRRAVQSYMDHMFSFSKILTPSDLISSAFPDVGTLSNLTELITSFCQQQERKA